MFFQLSEVDRLETHLQSMEQQKQQLSHTILKAATYDAPVQGSMQQTIQSIIENGKVTLETITNIEDQTDNGFLVPQDFDLQEFLQEKTDVPDWFEFVFKKEFLKQKNNFDLIAKKMFQMHGLREKKQELAAELKSFESIYSRYQVMGKVDQETLNIMSQAQTLKNKEKLISEKFSHFLSTISGKIAAFIQENISRSRNYSTQIKSFSHFSSINEIPPPMPENQPPPPRKIDLDPYHSNSKFYPLNYSELQERQRQRDLIQRAEKLKNNYDRQYNMSAQHYCRNHSQKNIYPQNNNKFNHRPYLGRWMNNPLSDYYH